MNNKKKITLVFSVISVLILASLVSLFLYRQHLDQVYYATYLVLDGKEYLRTTTELDLSGKPVSELEKLKELTALEQLNLRDTGITVAQYDDLKAALPNCEILWSVPFQNDYQPDFITSLKITSLSEEDLEMLKYFPNLKAVTADGCRDYEVLQRLTQQYPDLQISYSVSLSGQEYYYGYETITVSDPNIAELKKNLPYLPNVQSVRLEGNLPGNDAILELKNEFPQIIFDWDFNVCGVETSSTAEFLELSGMKLGTTDELEAALPYFYNLEKVDMVNCGFSNAEMAALNERHDAPLFVWTVNVSGVSLRTDTKYFMPVKYKIKEIGSLHNLKYCTEMVVMDFGHYGVYDFSYLEYMPKLEYLLALECSLYDVELIGQCTSLRFLEIPCTRVTDFWPLTNLTNLECLNLSYTPYFGNAKWGSFGDIAPLFQMTWLDRLWLANSGIGTANRELLYEALPDTTILFFSEGSCNKGWRQSPQYFEHRDIMDMFYMP